MQVKQYKNMRYWECLPDDFDENKKYPFLLYLHGAGERGEDMNNILNAGVPKSVAQGIQLPFIIVAPKCEDGHTWYDYGETLDNLFGVYLGKKYIDKKKVYLSGMSMGAYGAWAFAMSHADKLTAMIPVSGGGMVWNVDVLKNIAVWAFHCSGDDVVDVNETIKMVNALKKVSSAEVRLTIYDHSYHDAWTDTYSNPAIYEWLLTKTL